MAAADTFLPAIEKAKQISVYRNGDDKFPGKRIIVNKRKIANFDVFLDEVTQCLRPRCGAIQRLYTPVNGHRITDLDSVIKRGENFVAAGKEKFHKLGYLEIEVSPRKRSNKGFLEIRPVRHSRIQTSGRIKKVQTEPIIIFVHPNGYNLDGPHRIQLRRREQGSWDLVYDAIKERVSLVTGGAIRKLYTLEGHPVHSVHEIENLGCYVACGKEAFKDIDYNQPKPPMYSPRLERRKYQHGQKLTPLSQSQRTSKKGSQNNSINRTPESINGSLNSRQHKARRKVKKEDQVIHERPVAYKRNSQPDDKTKEINYDQDPGGVFRAQRQNPSTRGAAEVTEDRETRVDVPVDQRRAEVVEEEKIEDEEGNPPSYDRSEATPPASLKAPSPFARQEPYVSQSPPPQRDHTPSPVEEMRQSTPLENNTAELDSAQQGISEPITAQQQDVAEDETLQQQATAGDSQQPETTEQATAEDSQQPETAQQETAELEYPNAVTDELDPEDSKPGETTEGTQKQQERQRGKKAPNQHEEESAAVVIQSNYRGYRTRQDLARKQDNNAATVIQSGYRGYKTRQQLKEREKAATVIQSGYRGYKTRKRLKQEGSL